MKGAGKCLCSAHGAAKQRAAKKAAAAAAAASEVETSMDHVARLAEEHADAEAATGTAAWFVAYNKHACLATATLRINNYPETANMQFPFRDIGSFRMVEGLVNLERRAVVRITIRDGGTFSDAAAAWPRLLIEVCFGEVHARELLDVRDRDARFVGSDKTFAELLGVERAALLCDAAYAQGALESAIAAGDVATTSDAGGRDPRARYNNDPRFSAPALSLAELVGEAWARTKDAELEELASAAIGPSDHGEEAGDIAPRLLDASVIIRDERGDLLRAGDIIQAPVHKRDNDVLRASAALAKRAVENARVLLRELGCDGSTASVQRVIASRSAAHVNRVLAYLDSTIAAVLRLREAVAASRERRALESTRTLLGDTEAASIMVACVRDAMNPACRYCGMPLRFARGEDTLLAACTHCGQSSCALCLLVVPRRSTELASLSAESADTLPLFCAVGGFDHHRLAEEFLGPEGAPREAERLGAQRSPEPVEMRAERMKDLVVVKLDPGKQGAFRDDFLPDGYAIEPRPPSEEERAAFHREQKQEVKCEVDWRMAQMDIEALIANKKARRTDDDTKGVTLFVPTVKEIEYQIRRDVEYRKWLEMRHGADSFICAAVRPPVQSLAGSPRVQDATDLTMDGCTIARHSCSRVDFGLTGLYVFMPGTGGRGTGGVNRLRGCRHETRALMSDVGNAGAHTGPCPATLSALHRIDPVAYVDPITVSADAARNRLTARRLVRRLVALRIAFGGSTFRDVGVAVHHQEGFGPWFAKAVLAVSKLSPDGAENPFTPAWVRELVATIEPMMFTA